MIICAHSTIGKRFQRADRASARDLPGIVPERDSKDPDGPVLVFNHREWKAFLDGVNKNEFGLP
ncbi:DUF397 domain-containing protein [Nonomuraea sp. B10E15]|uniref:DUF397 domain-containing protein n=1 Tax=Nonomuraea sp. B10E15 TaxID=3153560 RepID=UPI00325D479D